MFIGENDIPVRNELEKILVSVDQFNKVPLLNRCNNETRIILKELPKQIKALVIHKRFFVRTYPPSHIYSMIMSYDNICVECTLIGENYTVGIKQIYDPAVVVRHVLKNQSNVLVNLL